jgi:hypothetical protein
MESENVGFGGLGARFGAIEREPRDVMESMQKVAAGALEPVDVVAGMQRVDHEQAKAAEARLWLERERQERMRSCRSEALELALRNSPGMQPGELVAAAKVFFDFLFTPVAGDAGNR